MDENFLAVFLVVEAQLVELAVVVGRGARADGRLGFVGLGGVRRVRRLVVEAACDEGPVRVSTEVADHHFHADARQEVDAKAVPRPGLHDAQVAA